MDYIERNGKGLNLPYEVKNGIATHTDKMACTKEGYIVRVADKIAYINHDIDDAIRGKIIREEDIPAEFTDVLGNSTKKRLNTLIHDIVLNSIDKPKILMSKEIEKAMMELRVFMFNYVYTNPIAKGEEQKAKKMLQELYRYYLNHLDELPPEFHYFMEKKGQDENRVVCDYIAGMSDQYSVKKFQEIYVPLFWKR